MSPGCSAVSPKQVLTSRASSRVAPQIERLELTMFTDQRQYDFRCESTKDLEGWKRASEKTIGAWLQS